MDPEQKVDKRHMRTIATRSKILSAAMSVFLLEGYQKTTISQIIKQAKIGYGTAYVHFDGKDAILIELMDNVMARFFQIAEAPFFPKSKEEAKKLIEKQTFEFLKMADIERPMMRVIKEAIGFSPAVYEKWKEIRQKFIKGIETDILFSQRSGIANSELNHVVVARGWFFSNEMYLWEIVEDERNASVQEIAKTIAAVYIRGLYL